MKIAVGYYLKNQPKQYARFDTLKEAQSFMKALAENKDCECYGIEKT